MKLSQWSTLSKSQKRVMLANDVLEYLDSKRIICGPGLTPYIFVSKNPDENNKLYEARLQQLCADGMGASEVFSREDITCHCCAQGALFYAYVMGVENSVSFRVTLDDAIGVIHFSAELEDIFGVAVWKAIEHIYELTAASPAELRRVDGWDNFSKEERCRWLMNKIISAEGADNWLPLV